MTDPELAILLSEADYKQAKEHADETAILRLVRGDADISSLPADVVPFIGRATRIRSVILAFAAAAALSVGLAALVRATWHELTTSLASLALIFPAVLVLVVWFVPFIMIGSIHKEAPLRAMYDSIRGRRGQPGKVHRLWISTGEDGGISGLVTWIEVADGTDVLTGEVGWTPMTESRMVLSELPQEGDRAWVWRVPTGHILTQVRRRRIGEVAENS